MNLQLRCAALVLALLPLAVQPASGARPERREGFQLSYTTILQAPGDLEGGGELASDRHLLRLGRSYAPTGTLIWGWQLGIDRHHYRFDGPVSTLPTRWSELYRVEVGGNLLYRLTQTSSLMLAPSVSFAGERDAEVGDAAAAGGIVAYSWQGENLRLGIGGALFAGLEEVTGFPVVMLDWRIDETWRLANPLRAGPTGPAGLELSARLPERWEAGLGGAWRSFRFRLDPDDAVPKGIVDDRMVPVWLRVSKSLGPLRVDLYGGATLAHELTIEDRDGDRLVRRDVDPAPFFALTLLGRF